MKSIFFSFFILIYFSSFSQKTVKPEYENTSLDTILKVLEKSYNIKFSFNPDIIKDEKITILEKGSLEKILQKIQSQTLVLFEKVNDRYYVIRKKRKKGRIPICGYLLDSVTKKPLPEAFVSNKNQSKSVISDINGYFQLFLSEPNDTIDIRFLGYKNKQFIAKQLESTDCAKILLSEDDFQLGEVVITEYVTSGISRQGASSAINIDPSKLGILPRLVEPDVLQTLQFLPGVQSPTETASALHIRGGTPDHNLILWDGIKMYSTGHFFDLLSIFNPYITENIKLFRSSTEAKYGNRISGVVDIESKNEIPKDFGFGIGFNMTSADAYIEVPVNKDLGFIISGRRAFTDFIETATFRSYSERAFQSIRFFVDNQKLDQETVENENVFYFTDLTVKAILDISENEKFTISSIFTNNDLDYILNIKNIQGFSEPFDENQIDNLKFVNQGVNMKWDKNWNTDFSLSANVYFSNYDFDYNGVRESRATSDGFLFFQNNIVEKNVIRDTGSSLHANWKINSKNSFVSGYDFSTNDVSYNADYSASRFTFDESNSNITHAVFGEYKFNSNEKIKISAGIRGNYFSVLDKAYWEPRINVEITLFKDIISKISAERKNQVISQISNYLPNDFNLDNQIWLLADSEFVSMLSSDQFSGGFSINKNDWYIDIEGYYKSTSGLTSFANGFNGVLDLETGESEVFGLDVLIKKRINNYRTWIGYSLTDQDFKFEGVNEGEYFPGNFDISHYLSWIHSYQWNNFEFSLGWNIRTGRPFTPAQGITETDNLLFIDYGEVNSERLDTYHRLDFSASYKFNFSKSDTWRSKIGFSLFNLYDRKNILNRTYNIRFDNNDYLLQEVNTFSSGITPNVSFRIDF
ncbi:carboxypeptidase-like regulatory domain-containing protein [uncultured Aquimarina sp.]|uniref:carboxypeptidase-like regulatory domain-containing protein n=1 Tax=uncultured Aquimarina sp. TaxID=575652 RepID=UPI002626C167|nr:carboxypeptidase-like regulatory domain-containing protein [uncultured Aquimarina sp.]